MSEGQISAIVVFVISVAIFWVGYWNGVRDERKRTLDILDQYAKQRYLEIFKELINKGAKP